MSIKARRLALGFSQKRVADLAGIFTQQVYAAEKGGAISAERIASIENALDQAEKKLAADVNKFRAQVNEQKRLGRPIVIEVTKDELVAAGRVFVLAKENGVSVTIKEKNDD